MWTIIFFTSWQCSSFVMGNDDWLSHLSDEIQLKCEKSPPKSSKNEKLIFILHSTSDDWPSDPSNKRWPKCKKGPLSHQKMKWQHRRLMIGQVIWATKLDQNAKKGPLSYLLVVFCVIFCRSSSGLMMVFWWFSVLSSGSLLCYLLYYYY